MYQVTHVQNDSKGQEYIQLENSNTSSCARIYPNLGASLQVLTLDGHAIITDLKPLNYADTYASSLLFPFANRIQGGRYTYEGQTYQIAINEPGNNNALHGFVYDKPFQVIDQKTSKDFASVTLEYKETSQNTGFPFTYNIEVTYTLGDNTLDLQIIVTNTDTTPFPFTLGWHPYFTSANLYRSTFNFDSSKQFVFNDQCITNGSKAFDDSEHFEVLDKQLDDCFALNTNPVVFSTPDYKLLLKSSSKDSFLQLYTPPKANVIAIEPTTGISDSSNNGIGLQTLQPDDSYQITWGLEIL